MPKPCGLRPMELPKVPKPTRYPQNTTFFSFPLETVEIDPLTEIEEETSELSASEAAPDELMSGESGFE